LACFLVLLASGVGFFSAYFAFYGSALNLLPGEKKTAFHSANPNDLVFYENLYKFPKKNLDFSEAPVAGVIPHHLLAGDLIAEFFSNLAGFDYDTIVLIGPNHFNAGTGKAISSAIDWQTPYGVLPIDQDLLKEMTENNLAMVEENVFTNEQAINAEVAFIKKTFPSAKFLPLVLRPTVTPAEAENIAKTIFKASKEKKVLLLSSTDFSHYKISAEAQADDKKSIAALQDFSFNQVYDLAVDSPPATYVLLKYAYLSGAKFALLHNSNSALLSGKEDIQNTTSYITGYFEMPFLPEKELITGNILNSAVLPQANDNYLKFLFFGDLMLDRNVGERIKASSSLDYVFSDLAKSGIFSGNDIVSANLEGAVTKSGAHYPPANKFDFAFAPELVGGLSKYNFNYFNIANNHLADQGKNGIMETEKNLINLDFAFAGCQDHEVDACTAKIVEKNGRKFGFIGASMIYGALDENRLLAEVKKLASSTDLVVAQIHWGVEYQHKSAQNQVALAHKLIDAGVGLIIGHHPHVVGGLEIYKGKPIFYSLGNFVFDQDFSLDTQEELGVKISTDGKDFQIELLPLISKVSRPRLLAYKEKNKFLEKLASWSIGTEELKKQIKSGTIEIKNTRQ